MNKLFFILIKLIFLNHLPLRNQSVSQKVYLKFGKRIVKISEKSLTVWKDFVILKFEHKHFIHFYFSDGLLSQSFILILLWKLQSVPKLLGHWFGGCDKVQIKANIFMFGWSCSSPVFEVIGLTSVHYWPARELLAWLWVYFINVSAFNWLIN